jgi:hypothetical protein
LFGQRLDYATFPGAAVEASLVIIYANLGSQVSLE